MSKSLHIVNDIAVLSNVALAMEAVQSTIDRAANMPGIMCMHGRSGLGKSMAAAYLTLKYEACYIQGMDLWARRAYLEAILKDLGLEGIKGTNAKLLEAICDELGETQRMLIIDEADYLVDKGMAQIVMDFFEGSGCPVLMIGEENLPRKLLEKHNKIHRRVLHWIGAQPANLSDCNLLAEMYASDVSVAEDMLKYINEAVDGCTGRVALNLTKLRSVAKRAKITEVDREWWGDRPLELGKTESRRTR